MEKQSILTLILSLFCLASISQSNHCNPCKELPISIQFIAKTFEEMPQEAIELDFEVELLNDTADIFIDTILYKFNGMESWEVLDNTLAEAEYSAAERWYNNYASFGGGIRF